MRARPSPAGHSIPPAGCRDRPTGGPNPEAPPQARPGGAHLRAQSPKASVLHSRHGSTPGRGARLRSRMRHAEPAGHAIAGRCGTRTARCSTRFSMLCPGLPALSATTLRAVLHRIPIPCPLFSPGEWQAAVRTLLVRQVRLLMHRRNQKSRLSWEDVAPLPRGLSTRSRRIREACFFTMA